MAVNVRLFDPSIFLSVCLRHKCVRGFIQEIDVQYPSLSNVKIIIFFLNCCDFFHQYAKKRRTNGQRFINQFCNVTIFFMPQKFELFFFFVESHKHLALNKNHSENGANNNISVGFQRTQRNFSVNFKKRF